MSEDPPASAETKTTSFDDVTSETSQDDADLI